MLAPRLFAAGQEIRDLGNGGGLSLDAHQKCIVQLGNRVTAPLFISTITSAASA
jgi:hypothetical protein